MSSKIVGLWNVLLLGLIILVASQKIMKFPYGQRNLLFISLTFIPYLNVYEDIFSESTLPATFLTVALKSAQVKILFTLVSVLS